jgi:hypothetical protein
MNQIKRGGNVFLKEGVTPFDPCEHHIIIDNCCQIYFLFL